MLEKSFLPDGGGPRPPNELLRGELSLSLLGGSGGGPPVEDSLFVTFPGNDGGAFVGGGGGPLPIRLDTVDRGIPPLGPP